MHRDIQHKANGGLSNHGLKRQNYEEEHGCETGE